MERGGSLGIARVRTRPSLQQHLDRLHMALRRRKKKSTTRPSVTIIIIITGRAILTKQLEHRCVASLCRHLQRSGTMAVPGVWVCASTQQHVDNGILPGRASYRQRGPIAVCIPQLGGSAALQQCCHNCSLAVLRCGHEGAVPIRVLQIDMRSSQQEWCDETLLAADGASNQQRNARSARSRRF